MDYFQSKNTKQDHTTKHSLLRRRSSDLLGTPTDNDDAGDVLHQAVLSPPPRVKRNGAHKSLQIEFDPMLTEMYEEHRARNRQLVQEMNLQAPTVHQHNLTVEQGPLKQRNFFNYNG